MGIAAGQTDAPLRVAVTGASGFVGRALLAAFSPGHHRAVPIDRAMLADDIRLGDALGQADVVIQLAGLAHRTGRSAPAAGAFDAVNRDLPLRLYAAAGRAGVRRFIHVSTIHVVSGNPGLLTAGMQLAPVGPYAVAKAAAESGLRARARDGGPELAIVRPPLVFGAGAKGNLAALMRLCDSNLPLPFAAVANRRSFVGAGNLADALLFLAGYVQSLPLPAIYHVIDGPEMSLPTLITAIRGELGRAPLLFPLPPALLRAALAASGRAQLSVQLLDDLRVDDAPLRQLGWRPPHPPEWDLRSMVKHYLAAKGG